MRDLSDLFMDVLYNDAVCPLSMMRVYAWEVIRYTAT